MKKWNKKDAKAPVTENEVPQGAQLEELTARLTGICTQRDDTLARCTELEETLARGRRELDNFKRRNAMAFADGYTEGVCEVLTALLPGLDNLDRAISAAGEDDAVAKAVGEVLKKIFANTKAFGLEEIPALGEEFDPEVHNAVMSGEGDESGKVLEVFQKGYRAREKVLRCSMVKVSI